MTMNVFSEQEMSRVVAAQRGFFRSGTTLDVGWRIRQLKKLRAAIRASERELEDALQADLGRSRVEAYLCDIGPAIAEISEMIRHLRHWARPEIHFSGIPCFPSLLTKVYKMPYGVTLVVSPLM